MRADYGARAMIDLAQRHGAGLTQSATIAHRQQIPDAYLERLLTTLRRAGLVRSVRGPSGGHELARVASEITLGDIWTVLEGVDGPASYMDESGRCTVSPSCALQDVWRELADSSLQLLRSVTLEQLAERQARRAARPMYHI